MSVIDVQKFSASGTWSKSGGASLVKITWYVSGSGVGTSYLRTFLASGLGTTEAVTLAGALKNQFTFGTNWFYTEHVELITTSEVTIVTFGLPGQPMAKRWGGVVHGIGNRRVW